MISLETLLGPQTANETVARNIEPTYHSESEKERMFSIKNSGHLVRTSLALLAALAGFSVMMAGLASPAWAATFEVTNTNDSGDGSLRKAINAANGNGQADTIEISANGTVELQTALPELTTNIDIVGPGADQFTVKRSEAEGTPKFRIFTVDEEATVSVAGLTIANGVAPACGEFWPDGCGTGGGIYNGGTLTVTDSTISGNTTVNNDASGGGISNDGTLTVRDSTISKNTADFGGGINNYDDLNITGSTITENTANVRSGGIENSFGSTLIVKESTISENTAKETNDGGFLGGGEGGGIFSGGDLTVEGSTISGNNAYQGGGVYYRDGTAGTLIIKDSTVTGNTARSEFSSSGGGIYNGEGPLTVKNSTVSGNKADSGGGIYSDTELIGKLTVTGSTISGNNADYEGGGISSTGNTTITTSTLSGNSAGTAGGGVYNSDGLIIEYATITNNTTWGGEEGDPTKGEGGGGGVAIEGDEDQFAPRTKISSSIIVGNNVSDVDFVCASSVQNCSNTFTSQGYNLIRDGNATGTFDQSGDQIHVSSQQAFGTDTPQLAGNGGPTKTIALQAGSAAIDRVPSGTNGCGGEIQTDQRGEERIAVDEGGDGVCDTGAFEFGSGAAPDPAGRTPLIFVPGIGGSKLLYEDGDEKWPRISGYTNSIVYDLFDAFLLDLRLAENGKDPRNTDWKYKTKVGDVIRHDDIQVPGFEGEDAYRTMVTTLTREYGYVEGHDLFLFPFDWRKNVRTTEGGNAAGLEDCAGIAQGVTLNEFIDCVGDETGSEKVNIMAHSQGGLVTQAALSKEESKGKVNRVLTLGTPFLGAAQALGILQYRSSCFGKEVIGIGLCVVNASRAQEIFKNFPGAYQLLPSRAYHKVEGSPLVINNKQKSYNDWTDLIKRDRNAEIMELADKYHEAQDRSSPVDPSVMWFRIVGYGKPTPSLVRVYELCEPWSRGLSCGRHVGTGWSDGDGTVPRHSASLYNPDPDGNGNTNDAVDLRNGIRSIHLRGVDHGELPKNKQVLAFANRYFGNIEPNSAEASASNAQSMLVSQSTFSAQSSTEEPSPKELAEEFGFDETPTGSFKGIELESVGAVEGYVEDENGNVLGNPPDAPEGLIVEEVPGGLYNAIQDTQSFFLTEDGSFTSNLEVTNKEGARLRVRTYDEGEKTGQAVFQVAAPEGSELEVDFTDGQDLQDVQLSVDEDGDGNAEQQQEPDSVVTGPEASDTAPPEVEASYEETNSDKARVTIKATDNEGGSDIANIYYSIEGQEGEPRLYEEPFTVPLGSVVRYTATDKAGNTSDVKEIKIDKQPPDDGNDGGGGSGSCTITGTNGRDVLRGTSGRDVICGRGGNDTILGRGGNDKILGQGGKDRIRGGSGKDVIRGGARKDIIRGGSGRDRLYGQNGNDRLYGQGGRDTLLGGNGRDVLIGGPGKDRLRGGPGRDRQRQ